MSTPGLLMAFTKRGPTTTPEDWEEWYNTEHVPVLQSCPGWLTFARYNVLTPGCPPYVAMHAFSSLSTLRYLANIDMERYDLETAQAARDAQKWVPNRPHVPQRELRCLADATSYDDHIYEFDEDPSAWTAGGPGKGVVLEWAAPGFEEQYATKVKALEEVDGFIRARRLAADLSPATKGSC